MSSEDLQDLLRFLSQDAKIPLIAAIGKAKELQKASLMGPEAIAKLSTGELQLILSDEKTTKQVLNAAKRTNRKRSAPVEPSLATPKRRRKGLSPSVEAVPPAESEASLALPLSNLNEEELSKASVFTNRAPLVLAFVVVLLKYTMPGQPISSRLSLAHAYVSISSRNRAVNLGIEKGVGADEAGWGAGQPQVKILGKSISVIRRIDYNEAGGDSGAGNSKQWRPRETQTNQAEEIALWALDLEALRKSNSSNAITTGQQPGMPIYTAQSARKYLLKAATPFPDEGDTNRKKKKSTKSRSEEIEDHLGMLLRAIDLVYESWLPQIGSEGLDKRTWSWYAQVRPEITSGREGWGEKNRVNLSKILELKRKFEV